MECANGHEFDGVGRVIMEGEHKGKVVCRQCDHGRGPVLHRKAVFPFTTTNVADRPGVPITFENIYQLRKAEAKFGIQSHCFNVDQAHWDDPKSKRV